MHAVDRASSGSSMAVQAYTRWARMLARGGWPLRYTFACANIALVTILIELSGMTFEPANISLFYLLAVLLSAVSTGLGPAILASLLAFFAYNFFFVEPLYILIVHDPQDVLRLLSFLFAAILASSLAALVHWQAEQLGLRAAEIGALYDTSQATSASVDLAQILPTLAQTTVDLLRVRACVLTVALGERTHCFVAPTGAAIAASDPAAIEQPLSLQDRQLGSLRIYPQPQQALHAAERRVLTLLANQAALAVERVRLVAQAAEAQALAESDRLKSALLSSVSHDLRTPLVSIKGIATALRQREVAWDSAAGAQLLDTLNDEADRLNRLVGDLLDMSRIESGALHPARQWEDLSDLVGAVLARMRQQLRERALEIDLPIDLPLVWVNAGQIDQVLTNLLENALKYTPGGSPIDISAELEAHAICVHVIDHGPGIPAEALPHIFDKFFRAIGPERHAEGTGLGLAICKGIIDAHGGRIWACNRPGGGAELIFTLPVEAPGSGPDERDRQRV